MSSSDPTPALPPPLLTNSTHLIILNTASHEPQHFPLHHRPAPTRSAETPRRHFVDVQPPRVVKAPGPHARRRRSTGARLGELNDEIVDWVNRENRGASDNKSELSAEETKDNGNQWHAHPSLTPMSPPPPSCDRRHCLSPPAIRPKIILLPDGTSKRILIPSNTIQT